MGFKQLTATQLPLFWRVHLRRRLPWCVRKHTKSVQRWHLCAGLRRSARTGGGGISAVTAAARPSACMGDSSTRAATAAVRRSACMNGGGSSVATAAALQSVSTDDSGRTAATATILCVKSRAVLGKTSRGPRIVGNTLIFPMTFLLRYLSNSLPVLDWLRVHPASLQRSLPRRAGWCLWVLNTLAPTQLPPFWRVHLRRRLPWCVRKHTKSVQRWYLCAGRRSARTALLLRTAGRAAVEERGASMTPVAWNVACASPKHTAVMTGESDPVRSVLGPAPSLSAARHVAQQGLPACVLRRLWSPRPQLLHVAVLRVEVSRRVRRARKAPASFTRRSVRTLNSVVFHVLGRAVHLAPPPQRWPLRLHARRCAAPQQWLTLLHPKDGCAVLVPQPGSRTVGAPAAAGPWPPCSARSPARRRG